jgi:hypothetical protein
MVLGDLTFAARNNYDPTSGTMENLYTIRRDERSETKRAVHRIYSCSEILRMLREAGLGRFETYGSLERDPFRLGSPSLLVVATKNV